MSSSKNILENNIITHNDYRFNKKNAGKKHILYWCVCNRSSKSICTSKIRMNLDNITVLEETGDHDVFSRRRVVKKDHLLISPIFLRVLILKKDQSISLKKCTQEL